MDRVECFFYGGLFGVVAMFVVVEAFLFFGGDFTLITGASFVRVDGLVEEPVCNLLNKNSFYLGQVSPCYSEALDMGWDVIDCFNEHGGDRCFVLKEEHERKVFECRVLNDVWRRC